MLYLSDPPTFLIQHRMVNDTSNRKFGVLLDGIILEVLVAAVPVNKVAPLGVAVANPAAERQSHRRRLNIERLIVFYQAYGLVNIQRVVIGLNGLQKECQMQGLE